MRLCSNLILDFTVNMHEWTYAHTHTLTYYTHTHTHAVDRLIIVLFPLIDKTSCIKLLFNERLI